MAQRWMKKIRGEPYAYPYSAATIKERDDMIEIDEAEAMALLAEYAKVRADRRAAKVAADHAVLYPEPPPVEEPKPVEAEAPEAPKPRARKQALQGPTVFISG